MFDIIFCSLAFLLLSPLFILILIILKLTGEGEIFFLQERIGKYGKKFNIIKFATMLKNSPNIGTGNITLKNDPRVLFFGRFLRKTKINELPQILNVLKNDMTLVGPRPLTLDNFNFYNENVKKKIISQKPGLSGGASLFFRNEDDLIRNRKNARKFYEYHIAPYKGTLEEYFINRSNIKNYFIIIFLTAVFLFINASKLMLFFYKDIPKPPKELI